MSTYNYEDAFFTRQDIKDVPEGDLFAPWKLQILTKQAFAQLTHTNQFVYLACFGVLAPSTHNTVPERFRIDAKTTSLQILIDRKFVLAHSDPTGRQASVSVGCVLTNIETAAAYYGLTMQYVVEDTAILPFSPHEDRYVHIATVSFITTKAESSAELLEALLHRKVIRSEYDNSQKLSDSLINTLQILSAKHHLNCTLHIITGKLPLFTLAKFEEAAMRTVLEREVFARELGAWLLENNENSLPYAMRGKEFGFDNRFTSKLHQGLLGQKRLLPDEIAAFALGGKMMMNSSPAIGVITIPEDSIKFQIEAGMLYEYCALLLQKEHFTTAVHAGITEVSVVNRMWALSFKTSERPTVVFRIGKPLDKKDWLRAHSVRPHIRDVFLGK